MSNNPVYKEYTITVENTEFILFNSNTKYTITYDENIGNNNFFHSHSYNEIFYVLDGEIKIKNDTDIFILKSGDLAIIPAGYMHHTDATEKFNSICVIGYSINKLKDKSTKDTFTEFSSMLEPNKIIIINNFENYDSFKRFVIYQNYADSYHLSKCCLTEIIYFIKMHLLKNNPTGFLTSGLDNINYRNYIIEQYINKEYNKKPTLTELAELLYISVPQLQRIIKKIYNRTFMDVIINLRIENTKKLLKETNLSFAKISSLMGYETPHSLFYLFKRYCNMTPLEWRTANNDSSSE